MIRVAFEYPLQWPAGWPRTDAAMRKPAPFFRTVERGEQYRYRVRVDRTEVEAGDEVLRQLCLMGALADDIVCTTDLRVRVRDQRPEARQQRIIDPGAAVYFALGKENRVLACDRWSRVADNLWAIAKHVEAIRAQERWGVGTIEQAMRAYVAIGAGGPRPWRDVLGLRDAVSRDEVQRAYRELARQRHPDFGGTDAAMAELNAAREAALREVAA